jgi:hypothetical protein
MEAGATPPIKMMNPSAQTATSKAIIAAGYTTSSQVQITGDLVLIPQLCESTGFGSLDTPFFNW